MTTLSLGAAGWYYFFDIGPLAWLCKASVILALPIGVVVSFLDPSRYSFVEGVAGEIGNDELEGLNPSAVQPARSDAKASAPQSKASGGRIE